MKFKIQLLLKLLTDFLRQVGLNTASNAPTIVAITTAVVIHLTVAIYDDESAVLERSHNESTPALSSLVTCTGLVEITVHIPSRKSGVDLAVAGQHERVVGQPRSRRWRDCCQSTNILCVLRRIP